MLHTLFPIKVYLDQESHTYKDDLGRTFIGFSKLYSYIAPKFDAEMVSRNIARVTGERAEDILNKWSSQTNQGTRIDKALEVYAQTGIVLDADKDIEELVKDALTKYSVYNKTFEQGIPYDLDLRMAGSWDKLSLVSNRKDCDFHMSDFKCFEKGYDSLFKVSGQKNLNAPFNHLPNNKYTKICFQLSYYAHLFEELTGRKCAKLFIDLIVPKWDENGKLESYTNQVVPVMYMKNDVKLLINTFKDKVLEDLEGYSEIYSTEEEEF